ncbi:MAG: DUF2256 and DUF3253 domain-containing protein [Planctomycetota bacterium]
MPKSDSSKPEPKICIVCGREIEWRKKWERDWDTVKYCSKSCRQKKLSPTDEALERAITDLLNQRGPGKTICPSEAAKRVDPDNWRDLMEPARMAARRLVARGEARIMQQGHEVDPSTAKGPIRIGR